MKTKIATKVANHKKSKLKDKSKTFFFFSSSTVFKKYINTNYLIWDGSQLAKVINLRGFSNNIFRRSIYDSLLNFTEFPLDTGTFQTSFFSFSFSTDILRRGLMYRMYFKHPRTQWKIDSYGFHCSFIVNSIEGNIFSHSS